MADPGDAAAMDAHATPQWRVKVGARRRLNLAVRGQGGPAVILAAGANGATWDWFRVAPLVAEVTRAVAFDRPGMGFSDPAPPPCAAASVVEDLRAALAAAAIPPPYLLVGHSWGGVEMLLCALRRPEEAAGLVLVDTATWTRESIPQWQAERRRQLPAWRGIERLARAGAFGPGDRDYDARLPPAWATSAMRETLLARLGSASWWRALRLSTLGQARSALDLAAAWRPLGDLPIVDLVAARNAAPDWLTPSKSADHDALARLSTRYDRRVVDSGHHIPFQQPQAVVDAIADVLAMARG